MSYIDGLASGLDTTSIIKGLMDVERIPQQLLEARKATVQRGLDAWATIRTKVGSVRTAADAISQSTSWRPLTATSSNTAAVAVSASTGTATGSISFTVDRLATAQQWASADNLGGNFTGLEATLGDRTISIDGVDADGNPVSFASALGPDATLGDLIDEINADPIGVTASAIQVRPDEYRLILTADRTGEDNGFAVTLGGAQWGGAGTDVVGAQDSRLYVGGPGGIEITRSSNTISDLLDGATITLKETTVSAVTVTVNRDSGALANKVKALVDAVNGALSEIKLRTGYDAENNQASSLTGNSTARRVAQDLTRALTDVVGESGLPTMAGVTLARDGSVTFDEAAFTAAYEADPAAVEALFVRSGSGTGHVSFSSANWRAVAGNYDVLITKSDNGDGTFSYTGKIGEHDATVTFDEVAGTYTVAADQFDLTYGGLTVTVASAATTDLDTNLGAAVTVGTVAYQPGAAQRLSTEANRALDAVDGYLTSTENAAKSRIDDMDRQLERWDIRLEKREATLRAQFNALEVAMSAMSSQATWLAGQLSQLSAHSQ